MEEIPYINYLVIDDEITARKAEQEDFVKDMAYVNTIPQFVASCEEALDALKKNRNIKFCFLDCKLPKTIKDSVNYQPNKSLDYGIELANEIKKNYGQLPLVVFSAYVEETMLEKQANSHSNIVGYLRKDEPPESYRKAFKLLLQHSGISIDDFELQNKRLSASNTGFNYEMLSVEDRLMVEEKTYTIKNLAKKTVQSILQIGQNLIEVKAALPSGTFYSWVNAEFPWSIAMVNRFMRAYNKFSDMPVEELELLPITVLYELSLKSVDDEAIKETINIAKAGEDITIAKVKKIKNKYSKQKEDIEIGSKRVSLEENTVESKTEYSDREIPPIKSRDTNKLVKDYELIDDSTANMSGSETFLTKSPPNQINSKQQIIQIIPQKRLWNIDKHVVYNGHPNSGKFLELLPPKALICLNFSSELNFKFLYNQYDSWLNFHVKNPSLDSKKLVNLISETIASSVEELDAVIVLYIPDENILNIIHEWYCKAYIVDPDYQKCLNLVEKGLCI